MKEIKSFSFRYGLNDGSMAWYRVDNEKGLNIGIDLYQNKEEKSLRCEPEEIWGERLVQLLEEENIKAWDGFYDIDTCLCAGDSWVFHAYYKDDGTEVHAMGHSAHPDGFAETKKKLDDFFNEVWNKYMKK